MRKRACDACHRRKIQCDGAAPHCNWCHHHGMACVFTRVSRARTRQGGVKSPAQRGSGEDLALRLSRVEQFLAATTGRVTASATTSPNLGGSSSSSTPCPCPPEITEATGEITEAAGQATREGTTEATRETARETTRTPDHNNHGAGGPGVCFGKLHVAGRSLGNISSYSGLPFFSAAGQKWISFCTGEEVAFPAIWGRTPPWQAQYRAHSFLLPASGSTSAAEAGSLNQAVVDMSLPDRWLVEDYLRFFRSSHFRLEFPVVDTIMFQNTINIAYEPCQSSPSPDSITAKASIFAFLACMSLFEGDRRPPGPSVDGAIFAIKAQHLFPILLQDFTITGLQTVLMLLFSGQIPSSAMYHSLACRITFMLGGHTMPDPWSTADADSETARIDPAGQQLKRHLRKLFWLCYTFDKEISLRTGQPPSIDDEHCDLTLPGGYLEIQYLDMYADVALRDETAVPILMGDLRLSIIKSKACNLLYSSQALRKSDAELLRDIRELDDELERWRLSIPPKHQPALALHQPHAMAEPKVEKSDSIRTMVINFEYHYLVTTIHRATGRCRAWAEGESFEMEGVSSSLALSVEASRSTLIYMRSAMNSLLAEAFWMLVFYPMSAVVAIFCSILLNPLDPRAEQDLELLSSAPDLIKTFQMQRMTQTELAHLKMADEFLAELARLSRSAIAKAKIEQRNHHRIGFT
ncbi:hypothetical protein B0T17DRAFT_592780 [Bombardia bombarda]|uniref:Zn(2)-C6 fungal-type domain-containing protein n=1 Tax=Bombardia bombarda TaxID=252184 RepID=A0AA39WGC2_9PEZI|nr:hypothetical protein B0T17DRAFT_592780 [Bombardia bombarda]